MRRTRLVPAPSPRPLGRRIVGTSTRAHPVVAARATAGRGQVTSPAVTEAHMAPVQERTDHGEQIARQQQRHSQLPIRRSHHRDSISLPRLASSRIPKRKCPPTGVHAVGGHALSRESQLLSSIREPVRIGSDYFFSPAPASSPSSFLMVGSMAAAQISYPFSLGWSRSGMRSFGRVPSSSRNSALMSRKNTR